MTHFIANDSCPPSSLLVRTRVVRSTIWERFCRSSANFCTASRREHAEAAKEAETAKEGKEEKEAFEFSSRCPTS